MRYSQTERFYVNWYFHADFNLQLVKGAFIITTIMKYYNNLLRIRADYSESSLRLQLQH